jgi:hypothetical protein
MERGGTSTMAQQGWAPLLFTLTVLAAKSGHTGSPTVSESSRRRFLTRNRKVNPVDVSLAVTIERGISMRTIEQQAGVSGCVAARCRAFDVLSPACAAALPVRLADRTTALKSMATRDGGGVIGRLLTGSLLL